jgi:hypothetical protein
VDCNEAITGGRSLKAWILINESMCQYETLQVRKKEACRLDLGFLSTRDNGFLRVTAKAVRERESILTVGIKGYKDLGTVKILN